MTQPEMVKAVLNGEYEIVLPKHRADRPDWYSDTGWEKPRMQALAQSIRDLGEGCTVYYVGAEMGELPAICQMNGARLYLFEPNPLAWPSIKAIWEANDLETPYCFPGFVSNATTVDVANHPLRRFPQWANGEIVGAHGFKELHLEAANYPQIRIDDVVANGGHPPDIITCDVEGSEFHVLRGAQETIERYTPALYPSIHPEMLALHWNEWSRDLRNWIIDRGYTERLLEWAHEAHFEYLPL
jgi:FkbM family methyltransferase